MNDPATPHSNLQSAGDVDTIIRQQGWSTATYASVLSDFITANQLWPQMLEYAKVRAQEENDECSGDPA